MSLTSDIAGDWQHIEGVEDVSLIPVDPEGTPVKGVKALMKALGGNPLQNSGAFATDPNDVTFHLWEATLQGVEPNNGYLIQQADGTRWTIASAGYSPRTSRYIVDVRQQV